MTNSSGANGANFILDIVIFPISHLVERRFNEAQNLLIKKKLKITNYLIMNLTKTEPMGWGGKADR